MLVAVPVTRWHRDQYTPEINAAFLAHMDRLTRTYRCRFFDYRDQVPDYLFKDIHHLAPEGAYYFSRRLTREVLSPAWKATREKRRYSAFSRNGNREYPLFAPFYGATARRYSIAAWIGSGTGF